MYIISDEVTTPQCHCRYSRYPVQLFIIAVILLVTGVTGSQ